MKQLILCNEGLEALELMKTLQAHEELLQGVQIVTPQEVSQDKGILTNLQDVEIVPMWGGAKEMMDVSGFVKHLPPPEEVPRWSPGFGAPMKRGKRR